MKIKLALLFGLLTISMILTGCEPLLVFDTKGPQAATISNVIWISIITMAVVVITVIVLLINMLVKYRASKQPEDYEPPHIEGNPIVEGIIVGIPILIVAFLSFVSVISTYQVEAVPEGYEDQEPLVIYASSSDWKWHFAYPEEDIETVNYVFIPTHRPVEFRLYSHSTISSFWIPQLAGQKYAMADMVNKLNVVADVPAEMVGRNSNFNGAGFAENTFNVTSLEPEEFDSWIEDIHATAEPITEEEFTKLLEPGHLGQMTFTGTHLDFLPAPEGENGGHNHGSSETDHGNHEDHEDTDTESEHDQH
ncbi:cytochrome aa3 quinol oxidase subunit II [Oceanobacillus chungangensis]|uniref:Cytochrome aa3 quinol oxidase subunit II n=1 Tax=Oceanobacillus chungangensis TaxID=1229152 RepID=A0A3D8PJS8_9BACI|nr:cytochrome aa3 quinol oxidase subunit II [Oceanobacillus chungangensis]RDW15922.1 cytochrome aa3 quinol oxidase subunit II [Oceanobacillus chungangensis]